MMDWLDRIRRNTPVEPPKSVPAVVPFNDGFDTPSERLNAQTVVFGANVEAKGLAPKYTDIPVEFRLKNGVRQARKWRELQNTWYTQGLPPGLLLPRQGVDEERAWQHLRALQATFELEFQHKAAAVAWLASRWFVFNSAPVAPPEEAYTKKDRNSKEGQ